MVTRRPDSSLVIGPLSASAPGPLYLQIINSFKREISEGRLVAGTALPSFRGLAEDLLVSVITVKRAYEELEREGIIYRHQGLGTFVADLASDRSREAKTDRATALFREGIREAREAGLTDKAIRQTVNDLLRSTTDVSDESPIPTHGSQGASSHVRKRD